MRMLASVRDLDEARVAFDAGVDLIDLKQPADGALGALPVDDIRAVVNFVAGRVAISATAGNVEADAAAVHSAMADIAATGVDYVKAGLFPPRWTHGGRDYAPVRACLAGLHPLSGVRRIAVMFADLAPPADLVDAVADAGFDGVMVDTAHKAGLSLPDVASRAWLADFVSRARARGLLCGLAGSLRLHHVAELMTLQPDYLGFRGALCADHARAGGLDREAVLRVREALREVAPLGVD
jgi:uncharacterized protein (UPF0264 family)